jgi:hypothetical protein
LPVRKNFFNFLLNLSPDSTIYVYVSRFEINIKSIIKTGRHGRRPAKFKEDKKMRINTNLTALNTYTQYTNNNVKIAKATEKLSSGSA